MLSANMINLVSQLAAPAFFDMLALAGFGALVPAVAAEAAGAASGRALPVKFAEQISRMFTSFMGIAAIAFLGGVVIMSRSVPWLQNWLTSPESPVLPALAAWGAALLLGGLYAFSFKKMRASRGAHLTIGVLAMLAALSVIPLSVLAAPDMLAAFGSGQAPELRPLAVPGPDSLLWPFALQFTLLSIGLAGGLGMSYLIYRRKTDDFGRDYYNFALRTAARWGAPFIFLQSGGMGWLLLSISSDERNLLLDSSLAPILYAGAGLALACALAWVPVLRSKTPMRLKGLILFSGLLAWGIQIAATTLAFVLLPAA